MTSPGTLARIERACAELLRLNQPVSFTTVAASAGISRATLYRNESLRAVVEEYKQRSRSHDPHSISGVVAEVDHLRTAVEALAARVRKHDEQLRRLTRARKAT